MMTYVVIKVSQFVHLNLQHSHWCKFLFALLDIIRAILALSTSVFFWINEGNYFCFISPNFAWILFKFSLKLYCLFFIIGIEVC